VKTDEFTYIKCKYKFSPNLLGELKDNYVTPVYKIEQFNSKKEIVVQGLVRERMGFQKGNVLASIALGGDDKIMSLDKKTLKLDTDSETVLVWLKENKSPITHLVETLNNFQHENLKYLEQPEYAEALRVFTAATWTNIINGSNKLL